MPKNPQLVNRKNFIKRLTCTDNRKQKQKKGESISPIHKQINLQVNENIHPNSEYHQYVNFANPRQSFNFFKNKSENKERQVQNPLPPVNSPLRKPEVQHKQVKGSVVCGSFDNLHLYNERTTPKVSYFVQKMNKNQDLICCEELAKKYAQKVYLKKNKDALLGGFGITIGQCCQKLNENLNSLQNLKDNLVLYQGRYQEHTIKEEIKHNQYYQSIIDIVRQAQERSGLNLAKKISQGISVFSKKLNELNFQIKNTKKILRDLIQPQNKSYQTFNLDEVYRLYQIEPSLSAEVSLPFISVSVEKSLLSSFQGIFQEKYSLQLLKEEQFLEVQTKKSRNDIKKCLKQVKFISSIDEVENTKKKQCRKQIQNSEKSLNCSKDELQTLHNTSKSMNRYKNIDQNYDCELYCQESLGDNTKKVNSHENDLKIEDGIYPIIELTEEQDIISPAFKEM